MVFANTSSLEHVLSTYDRVKFPRVIASDIQTIWRVEGDRQVQRSKLLPDDGMPNDRFGYSVSDSGDRVDVDSFGHVDNGLDSGSAHFFLHDDAGWVQQGELLASDGTISDRLGCSVSISVFLSAFTIQDLPADCFGDCVFNFIDISLFLSLFSSGCP